MLTDYIEDAGEIYIESPSHTPFRQWDEIPTFYTNFEFQSITVSMTTHLCIDKLSARRLKDCLSAPELLKEIRE